MSVLLVFQTALGRIAKGLEHTVAGIPSYSRCVVYTCEPGHAYRCKERHSFIHLDKFWGLFFKGRHCTHTDIHMKDIQIVHFRTDPCGWTLKLSNISLVSQDMCKSSAPISLALLSLLLDTNFRIGSCLHAENPSMLKYLSSLSKILKMAVLA